MGHHLSDDIIHRIKLHIEASEDVTTIAKAVRVSRKTIYKLWLNLDIWGELYAPPTIVLG